MKILELSVIVIFNVILCVTGETWRTMREYTDKKPYAWAKYLIYDQVLFLFYKIEKGRCSVYEDGVYII